MSSTRARPFSRDNLASEIGRAAGARWRDFAGSPAQVRYLATYLANTEVGARTMLVEVPYVDRHYMEEYVGYYATSFRPPAPTATRIHFWTAAFDDRRWDEILESAAAEDAEKLQAELQQAYVGYAVIRPVAGCPIGRTVLRPFQGRRSRCYAPAESQHAVHLHGFTFQVRALPFQQQDQGLGACATTALWSSLARVVRADGGRAVTPLDVARAVPPQSTDAKPNLQSIASSALRRGLSWLRNGREISNDVPGSPAHLAQRRFIAAPDGLDLEQMKNAIRTLGYWPSVLAPTKQDEFLLALKAYVRSGIPVILRVRVQPSGETHAVTVAGFRESDDDAVAADLVLSAGGHVARAAGLTRLYLHDDRLGPYGRFAVCLPSAAEREEAEKHGWDPPLRLRFDPQKPGFDDYTEPAVVESAIAPLYAKVRVTAEDLIAQAMEYVPAARMLAEEDRDAVTVEVFYSLGGSYLAELGAVLKDPVRLARLRRSARLSRYVGVLRFSLEESWFFDVVVDTTAVFRGRDNASAPLLVTAHDSETLQSLTIMLCQVGKADDVLFC